MYKQQFFPLSKLGYKDYYILTIKGDVINTKSKRQLTLNNHKTFSLITQ